jgi:hypothetical protein
VSDNIEKLKEHSQMLGRIGMYVEDFAESDEDTTIICVLRLLARYHHMEADCMYDAIKDEKERNEAV